MHIKLTPGQTVPSAFTNLTVIILIGLVIGLLTGFLISWSLAPLVAWDIAAFIFIASTWRRVLKFDAALVKRHALREDPSRIASDLILLVASVASLAAVTLVLADSKADPLGAPTIAALSMVSVIISWLLIHTIYALKYAELYYEKPAGGVDFGDTTEPIYIDFAYLAFTLGMTYQVSDTTLGSRKFRTTALKHAALAYLFGTIIVATTINLVAGLGK